MASLSRKETARKQKRNRLRVGFGLLLVVGFILTSITIFSDLEVNQRFFESGQLGDRDIDVSVKSVIVEHKTKQSQSLQQSDSEPSTSFESVQEIEEDKNEIAGNAKVNNNTHLTSTTTELKEDKHNSFSTDSKMIVLNHKVKSKETIFSISSQYCDSNQVDQLLAFNSIQNPVLELKEGMTLLIPNPTYLAQHHVQKGETLFQIIRTYYSKSKLVSYVSEFNRLNEPSDLKAGMELTVFHGKQLINYTVNSSETIFGIMNSYYEFSTYLSIVKDENQLLDKVNAGTILKIVNPYHIKEGLLTTTNWNIEVNLNENKLILYKDGKAYKTATVATGKELKTPKGSYEIIVKISNPGYTPKNIQGGDPHNPLGTRWLGLNVEGTNGRTYGIHGTSDPTSIGKYVTNGCIRLENKEIEEIFNLVPVGTAVVIK